MTDQTDSNDDETIRIIRTDTYHETYEVPREAVEDGREAVEEAIEDGAEQVAKAEHGDPLSYRRTDTDERLE